jgi:hypothetical protein
VKPYKDRQAPPPRAPKTVVCPKCDQEVEVEVLEGRVRRVTTTRAHISKGRVCYAIIKTEENHR